MHDAAIRLTQGRIDDASHWAHAVLDDTAVRKHVPRYQRHQEQVLAAHVLIADGVYDDAAAASIHCEIDAETNDWDYSRVRISTLKALLNHKLGKQITATQSLRVALDLAAPQMCSRPFLDAGRAIVDLLEEAVARDVQRSFAQELIDSLALTVPLTEDDTPTANEALDEPLTDRELEILQLIAAGHSNRQIGEQLYIAIGTVGKHTSNIFLKLDAANRAAAVLRAQELRLL